MTGPEITGGLEIALLDERVVFGLPFGHCLGLRWGLDTLEGAAGDGTFAALGGSPFSHSGALGGDSGIHPALSATEHVGAVGAMIGVLLEPGLGATGFGRELLKGIHSHTQRDSPGMSRVLDHGVENTSGSFDRMAQHGAEALDLALGKVSEHVSGAGISKKRHPDQLGHWSCFLGRRDTDALASALREGFACSHE